MHLVVEYDNMQMGGKLVTRTTRPISWVAAARKEFEDFPGRTQDSKTPRHEIDLVEARIKRLKEML
ncbi:MAG TPA: hypothetical protein VLJ19_14710 [Variovorax sp.]|nr:hypothetical protein [Variovorax sp.]